ncbi:anhydro-N-acetylmuramic acid kinase [Photobacterium ganghwense]|uniref:anhydro-N-acetylmuramic acid kinase n=1 Tax=Photobacterium ganghwense TaxID=320778 RepID=UPI001C2D5D9A|nr:anhydro-N-acetylmuramic acid kinase [Photobacterium ganghwense]MBV1841795.1 anhydro-N-acetylmuramic acid kinase [Photobacterium ganghwense]
MSRELYVGVMSGTSLDGVDVALVAIEHEASDAQPVSVSLQAHYDHPMPDELKHALLEVCLGQATNLRQIGELDHRLGHLFADAVNALLRQKGISPQDVTAIGNHGQTVYHHPESEYPFTTQLGDANIIAAKTGITTVADFRRKDMALGGQGAPLVPAFHRILFAQANSTTVVLNIGGIANISVLPPSRTVAGMAGAVGGSGQNARVDSKAEAITDVHSGKVVGYDTGPGNMLMDAWIYQQQGDKYDRDGAYARSGRCHATLLAQLLSDPYLTQTYPKSTGREHYNLPWLNEQLALVAAATGERLAPEDVQATLLEFTARTIADQVYSFKFGPSPRLLVCGGGANNPALMARLSALLPEWLVGNTRDEGVDADYMEAMAFAWLARQRIHNQPSNVPEVTGASRPASLGVIYPAD